MRLCMMGTGPFAVPTFQSLLRSNHDVVALVTRPTIAARTHGKEAAPVNPMRQVAESHGLRILEPASINDEETITSLVELKAELLVVCDYGQILAPQALSAAPLGGINLHGSLLPKYRGAAPIQWAVWNGEPETGVTVIHMTPRLDAGPILVQRSTGIGSEETAAELEGRLSELGVDAVHQALQVLESWDRVSAIGHPQDPQLASRAPRLKKSHGEVDWSRTAQEIFNQFRAVQPWPGLFSNLHRAGKPPLRVILERIRPVSKDMGQPSGTAVADDGLLVATSSGSIQIERVQPAGKRGMDIAEFLRGHPLQAGDRFGRP